MGLISGSDMAQPCFEEMFICPYDLPKRIPKATAPELVNTVNQMVENSCSGENSASQNGLSYLEKSWPLDGAYGYVKNAMNTWLLPSGERIASNFSNEKWALLKEILYEFCVLYVFLYFSAFFSCGKSFGREKCRHCSEQYISRVQIL